MKRRSVSDAVPLNAWALDITGELTVDAVVQYLKLWRAVASVQLGVGRILSGGSGRRTECSP
jgi:hypothetical protein